MEYPQVKYQSCCTPCSKLKLTARIFIINLNSYRVVNCMVSTFKVIIFICADEREWTVVKYRNIMLCMSASKPNPWIGILIGKIIVSELVTICPKFYGNRSLISFFKRAENILSLCQ
jgi:hypothetical protein